MTWLALVLLTALTVASQDAWVKHSFGQEPLAEMAAYPLFYSLPLLVLLVVLVPLPPLDRLFWQAFLSGLPLNALGFMCYIRAIQRGPLSLVSPYFACTPLVMLLTGPLVLGEFPRPGGLLGVLALVAGSVLLHLDPAHPRSLRILARSWRQPGVRSMLAAASFYGLAAVLAKQAAVHSSPLFYAASFFLVHNIVLLLLLWGSGRLRPARLLRHPLAGCVSGFLIFVQLVCHNLAIVQTQAVYTIAVKRLSILMGVLYGGLCFKEDRLLQRLAGAAVMVAGSALIVLAG
ncbi:MAG: hypothetical protein BWK76_09815 [Desulfobulbaceae bacterium A2]|nr:MAG: hypothetical protein BWK76_09815 [Desulfobulbaceae bacterium A2]